MATVIKLKRGTSAPTTGNIADGEVAVDTTNKRFYVNNAGTIVELGINPTEITCAGTVDFSGATVTGITSTGSTLTGGTINNTPIGASTPSTGAFTTLTTAGDMGVNQSSPDARANFTTLHVGEGSSASSRILLDGQTKWALFSAAGNVFGIADETTAGDPTRFSIDAGGLVGIGAVGTASKLLHLKHATPAIRIEDSDGGYGEIEVDGGNLVFKADGGAAVADSIMKFEIDGTEHFRLEADGDLHASNDIIAFSTTPSDSRLKDDIVVIDNALDKVKALRGVSFTWATGRREGKPDIGVIAQEVEEQFPEIVREKRMVMFDNLEYKTVDYDKLVAVLIESVKELSDKVEALENASTIN
tara:strand:+ start:183 stop:1259 length:1077 start_codon:yes stop_codon:yes gene_type:complete